MEEKERESYASYMTDEQGEEIAPLYTGMRNCTWSKRELTEEKTKGRKRHIVVDVLGCLLSVVVHAANIHNTKGEISTAKRACERYPSIQKFCADAGYRGTFVSDLKRQLDLDVDFSEKTKPHQWEILPWRWMVKRTLSWPNHSRRLSKDYEISVSFAEASNKQRRKICQQATHSFIMDEYHEQSEKILLHLLNTATEELPGFSRLFFDRCILIHRDRDFLLHLMESQQNMHLLHTFLDYLYESDEDICEYAPVIKALGNGVAETRSEWNGRLVISDLVKCVVRRFDRGQNDPQIRTICLDVWDKLFMSNLQDIKPLSDMIDNFE